ncbi:UNVERIFIED_ORG: two-component system CheB/CheR fusion protein [Methylobacterium sp. SuP10 SLI 274]|nr:two-component system CheB/CheR fusion protein [Methylobacterium sp. SuP10 SLI 274]
MGQRTDPPGWPPNREATAQRILEFDWAEAALRASEEKYRTLFQTMGQGFCELEFVRDEQGRAVDFRYIELNPAFERLVGLPAAEARGRTGREVVPDLDLWWVETYDRIAATGLPARLEHTDTPMGRWFEVSVYPQANDRLLILYDDVTERKVAETALRDREERQAFLLALSDAVRSLTDPEAIQSAACRLVGERLDVDRCYYATADEAAGIIRIAWDHVRGDAPSIAGEHRLADFEWSAEILRRGECHVLADTQASVPEASRPAFAALQIGACMGTPLIKNGNLVGALWVTHSTPRDWTGADLGLLREVAERIWSAVERGRAEADIRRKNAVLEGINRIFREALTAPTEEELGRVCLAVAEDVTQSAFSFMGEVDHENDRFDELSISDRGWQHFAMENSAFSKGVGPKGLKIHGLYGRVLRDGKSLIANDPGSHPDRIGTPAGHPSLQAFLGVPLKRNGQTIGMIGLGNRAGGYRSEDLEAAEALAPAILQALLSKRTADTLRESEERFRTLAELVPSLLWNCDPEGKVIVVNQQWGAYTGQTQEEVQNGGWLATIPTDEREETKRIFTEAFTTGRPVERQQRIRRRDGPFRWFLIRHAPARDAEGRITRWIGAATDIHDQHIAAQSLRAEEARQAFLLDLADRLQDQTDPQAALQTVVEALGRHLGAGRVGYARLSADGKQIERQVGYHAESEARLGPLPITAFGRAVLDRLRNGETIIVDDAAAVAAPGVWQQGAVGSFVAVPLVRDGRVRTVLYLTHRQPRTWTRSETTLIEEVAARTWEAAERAQAETELRTSEARQRALVEGIPQLVWRAGDGGAWSWASPQWCRYTGQTEAESRGFGWLDAGSSRGSRPGPECLERRRRGRGAGRRLPNPSRPRGPLSLVPVAGPAAARGQRHRRVAGHLDRHRRPAAAAGAAGRDGGRVAAPHAQPHHGGALAGRADHGPKRFHADVPRAVLRPARGALAGAGPALPLDHRADHPARPHRHGARRPRCLGGVRPHLSRRPVRTAAQGDGADLRAGPARTRHQRPQIRRAFRRHGAAERDVAHLYRGRPDAARPALERDGDRAPARGGRRATARLRARADREGAALRPRRAHALRTERDRSALLDRPAAHGTAQGGASNQGPRDAGLTHGVGYGSGEAPFSVRP